VFAAGSRNDKIEKIVLAAIKAAASFDKSRLKAADELTELASLAVMGTDGSQAYVMPAQHPHMPAAQSSESRVSTTLHSCLHKLQIPREPEAVCMVVQMLGTRLGFAGGYTMEDTSNLFHALQDLHGWLCYSIVGCIVSLL
jgi:hypothetical protein